MIVPRLFRRLFPALGLTLSFLAGPITLWSQNSPIGEWDFVLTGRQRGVVKLAVLEDRTVSGIGVLNMARVNTNGTVVSNLFGSVTVQGVWAYEYGRTNRILGSMNLITQGYTNVDTVGVNFRGTAGRKRLNLLGYGFPGKIHFRGIPLSETNVDLSGVTPFSGIVSVKGVRFPRFEVFYLTTVQPNFYAVAGDGPAYSFTGDLLISNQRVAALSQLRVGPAVPDEISPVAAYVGPFNVRRSLGTLKGVDERHFGIRYRIAPEAPTSPP